MHDEIIIIEVEDDGIGINKAMQLQKEGQKDHISLATKISKERLENLNKLEKGKISMEIVDLATINNLFHVAFLIDNNTCNIHKLAFSFRIYNIAIKTF